MDASIHSTQLMAQKVSLPTPLTPVHTPPSRIVTPDPTGDTGNFTPIQNLEEKLVNILEFYVALPYTHI